MENMTQNKLIKNVEDKLESIKNRLESYKKVDATLSDDTLLQISFFLDLAEDSLEDGFVFDACDEIDMEILNGKSL